MTTMPLPPSDLTDEALKEWKRVAPLLGIDRKVKEVDQQMLAMYCNAVAFAAEAAETVRSEGVVIDGYRGSKVKHPALQVFRDMTATASALAKPLGITPEGRGKLKVEEQEPQTSDDEGFND